PGTPEEVWQAIATGPGISSWFMPAEFEERDGKPVALKVTFAPGMEPRSAVTAWDPPRMFATVVDGWMPGAPPIASEWTVEARGRPGHRRRGGVRHPESIRRPPTARHAGAGRRRARHHRHGRPDHRRAEPVPVRRPGRRNGRSRDAAVGRVVSKALPNADGAG